MKIVTTSLLLILGALAGCANAQTNNPQLQLISGNTQLNLARQGKGYALTNLIDRSKKRDFITTNSVAESKGLWSIEFRPQTGKDADAIVLDAATVDVVPQVTQTKDLVRLQWKGLTVGAQTNAADVNVTIATVKGSSMTDWRIAVNSRTQSTGLWQIDFPRISRLFVTPSGEAATPFGFGMVIPDPVSSPSMGFEQRYPEALYSMQFASLSEDNSCLYLGTHDAQANVKGMSFKKDANQTGLIYQVKQYPPGMGQPRTSYTQPYPCLMGVIGGDWVDAAKYYRKWVLSSSDWMRAKKPLVQNTAIPEWFKRLPLWLGLHGNTEQSIGQVEGFLRYMDVPVAIHAYHWHHNLHDHRYPDFWPPMPLTEAYFKRAQAAGGKVMPYTNAHLMDEKADSWAKDGAVRYAAKQPDGTTYGEIVDENRHLNVMCPATPYWQTKLNGLTTNIVRDLNVDGIYMDQVAAMPPSLCFDPTHGHPIGGGNYWVAGHAKQIANLRRTASAIKKDVFVTTESAGEPYDFDAYLRVNEGAPFLTPIWQQVYSGYRLSFGFYFYEKPEWTAKLATQYLWGLQIGWAGQHDPQDMPEIAAFEREVARARYAGSDYLALGEMLRDPQISGNFERFTTTWQNFASKMPIDWPAVKGSTWRAPDGTVGVALVNLHSQSQTATVTLQRKDLGFGKGPIRVRALYPKEMMPAQVVNGDVLAPQIQLPANTAALIVFEPVDASTSRIRVKANR